MTNIRDINLNLFPILKVLLEMRSVSKAADRLGLTQAAVSNALSKLRRLFNDELLTMVGREMRLTPRAEQLVEIVDQFHDIVDTALNEAEFEPNSWIGEFVIAAVDAVTALLLPKLVEKLSAQAPGVVIKWANLARSSVLELRHDVVDLIIAPPLVMGDDTLLSRHLYNDRFICIYDAKSRPKNEPLTLDEYLSRRHIATDLFSPDMPEFQNDFSDALFKLRGEQRNISIVPYYAILPILVENSDYMALSQERLVATLFKDSNLGYSAPPIKIPDIELSMLWSPRRQADPMHKWMRDTICNACSDFS
ncbi:MAG: LysR family transcriptional regulator [Pseudomonadota bacterium]